VKVQYCSDLHLEFEQNSKYMTNNPLNVCGDILILAGDIVPLHDEFLSHSFFNFISRRYKQIFWVPGNHEFYYKDISEYGKSFHIRLLGNISIVNNMDLHYEGIRFIFSTLWSRISRENEKIIEQSIADFECITSNNKRFKSSDFNKLHDDCIGFVNRSVNGNKDKTVIVTHHMPSILCNSPVHNTSPLNEAFCVDLTGCIEACKANFWIYGHSHFNQKPLFIGNTIMLTNQLGYVHLHESENFKQHAYFSV
jgi:Icc-related predicted phosphoesterase